jgi:predicted DNA repair protein MutK
LKGHGFTACGKMQMMEYELSVHSFTNCGKMHMVAHEASVHSFTDCGKMHMVEHEASGHDFSRAVNATKQMLGFSPCVCFSCNSHGKKTFSAAFKP